MPATILRWCALGFFVLVMFCLWTPSDNFNVPINVKLCLLMLIAIYLRLCAIDYTLYTRKPSNE